MYKPYFSAIAMALATLVSFSSTAQQLEKDPELIHKTLDNGFTYYIYPTDRVKNEAHFQLFIKVGSLQETKKQRGLAHFLEHMAFNGTKNFQKNELIRFLESKGAKFGADLNAHTSYHETIYKLQVPTRESSVVDSTLTILSDWASAITLDGEEIEKERGVVLAEWLSKQGPRRESQQVFLNALLNESHYADRAPIGDTAVLRNFKHRQLKKFYNKWYDPSLMAVAIAGDIDVEAVEKRIIEDFAPLKTSRPRLKTYEIPDYSEDVVTIFTDSYTDQIDLNLIQLIPSFGDIQSEQDYRDYLVRTLTGRLIKERYGKLSFNNPSYIDASLSIGNFLPAKGVHMASVELDKDSILEGIEQFLYETQQIYRHGFTSGEIDKIKSSYLRSFEDLMAKEEAPSPNVMIQEMHKEFFYNNQIVSRETEFELLQKYLPQIDSVSFVKALHPYKEPQPTYFLLTAGDEHKEMLPTPEQLLALRDKFQNGPVERYSNEVVVPERLLETLPQGGKLLSEQTIEEIDATLLQLSNGLQIIYKQTDLDKNNIVLSGFRRGGYYSLDSTQYLNGTYATPIISISGYGDFTREALSQYLAGSSAKAVLLADKTRTGFHASSNVSDKEELFQLLYLKWTEPRIDTDLYQQVKSSSIRNMKNETETPGAKFGRELRYLLMGENYITRKRTPEDVEEHLDPDAMLKAYDHFFGTANGYTVSVLTDQPLDSLRPLLVQYLGGLPTGEKDLEYKNAHQYPLVEESIEMIRNTGENPRATVSLVFQHREPIEDIRELDIKNALAKSILRSILLKRLREDMGAVYSVSVSASSSLHPIDLTRQTISFVSEPHRAEELIATTKEIVQDMALGRLDFSSELSETKTNLIKTHELMSQRNTFWTSAIRDHYFDGLDSWEYVLEYPEKVEAVSRDEMAAYFNHYFLESPVIKAVLYPTEEELEN